MRVRQPPVSHECIDGEVVAINMESGIYYSLLDLGARIWELVAAGWTRKEIVERVRTSYPNDVAAADTASAFLDELIAEGLIADAEAPRKPAAIEFPSSWAAPRFEKFTDLQEMLMLDPIHEVDAGAGWPHKSS